MSLTLVPWDTIRSLHRWVRRTFFRHGRCDGAHLHVECDEDTLVRALGERSFAPNWEYSYYSYGEQLNLAHVLYEEEKGVVWWQTHVRAWEHDDGYDLAAHWEPEPTEHPDEHLDEYYQNKVRGMRQLIYVLNDAGIEYTKEYR